MERQFFYWLFEPEEDDTSNKPLLVWLNGGPGCTSLMGLFIENGPFRFEKIQDKWSLEQNPDSWHTLGYLLYIDQPVGTGLSYTTDEHYCTNDEEVNEDLYAFLQNFLKVHKDVFLTNGKMNRKLWFSGESYAGHYIPSFLNYALNKDDLNIGGAAIGNGWTDPYYQYSSSMASYSKGIIDFSQWSFLNQQEQKCQATLKEGKYNEHICHSLLDQVIDSSSGATSNAKISFYDTRILDVERFPPNVDILEAYFGGGDVNLGVGDEVLEAVHATAFKNVNQEYKDCADPPYFALLHQDGKGARQELTNILNAQIPILFFNGIDDLICNHIGNEVFLNKLQWNKSHQWTTSAQRYAWKMEGSDNVVGYIKEYENLSFVKIRDAGHMAAMDQASVVKEMMRGFLEGGGLGGVKQDIEMSEPFEIGRCSVKDESDGKGEGGGFRLGSARKQLKTKRRVDYHSG